MRFQRFRIDGWKCRSCGEEYFDPDQASAILSLMKWRAQGFEVKLNQIRSNLILRLPVDLGRALHMENGTNVHISLDEKNRIIIEKTTS